MENTPSIVALLIASGASINLIVDEGFIMPAA